MTALRRRIVQDMELHGLSASTRESYVSAVKGLARYYGCSPDRMSEQQLREYFLYLINDRRVAASTLTVYLCGIKFFYESTLKRQWHVLELVRPKRRKKLPVVLSREEVRRVVTLVRCRTLKCPRTCGAANGSSMPNPLSKVPRRFSSTSAGMSTVSPSPTTASSPLTTAPPRSATRTPAMDAGKR
jgi:hypothetical protein